MGRHRLSVGRRGEQQVAGWYLERGYEVVARNWRCAQGEIDLLCRRIESARGKTLVVCEVKTRTTDAFGHALEAVPPRKQQRIRRVTAAFLRSQSARYEHVRFDVAAVSGGNVSVVEDAF